MRLLRVATALLFVALHVSLPIHPGVTNGASVEGITEYTLANGLRVLIFPDASRPTATINITYLVGSRHEGYGETGMAHLLEHLVFKGSTKHPNIPQELTDHGSRPNGTTWYDRTNYFETVPATEENILWALDLEADRMVISFIAKKDLESEFSVVRNEFESGENSPNNVLLQRALSTAFIWHNHGKSTIWRPQRHRERSDRAAPGLLPQVLSARQRRAGDRRQGGRSPGAAPGGGEIRGHPQAGALAGAGEPDLSHLYRGAGTGWRA